MIYVSVSVWLMVAVLLAWGVYHVWSRLAKPKTVNAVLLPGTLIAQLGHVVGLLITGASVDKTRLMEDDEDGAPATSPNPRPKIPVVGPVIVALLPLVALGAVINLTIVKLGLPVVEKMPQGQILIQLPAGLAAFWDQVRGLVTLAEGTLNAVRGAEAAHWRILLFGYLMVCLTVRMAPQPGNVRGHMGAVVAVGLVAWLVGTVWAFVPQMIERVWPLLCLTVGWLLLLMMVTLVVQGMVMSVRTFMRWER